MVKKVLRTYLRVWMRSLAVVCFFPLGWSPACCRGEGPAETGIRRLPCGTHFYALRVHLSRPLLTLHGWRPERRDDTACTIRISAGLETVVLVVLSRGFEGRALKVA